MVNATKKPTAKKTVIKKPIAAKKPTAKKTTYYLYFGRFDEQETNERVYCVVHYPEKPFATTDSIKKARLMAINQLKLYDTGGIIGISKKPTPTKNIWTPEVGAVMMVVNDPYDYPGARVLFQKPSIALKQGYKFSA